MAANRWNLKSTDERVDQRHELSIPAGDPSAVLPLGGNPQNDRRQRYPGRGRAVFVVYVPGMRSLPASQDRADWRRQVPIAGRTGSSLLFRSIAATLCSME